MLKRAAYLSILQCLPPPVTIRNCNQPSRKPARQASPGGSAGMILLIVLVLIGWSDVALNQQVPGSPAKPDTSATPVALVKVPLEAESALAALRDLLIAAKITILAGAFSVGIGFGLQNVINNFVSGLILLFERPIKVGDVIEVAGNTGEVSRIGIRASVIRTTDGSEVIVPNGSLISNPARNREFVITSQEITDFGVPLQSSISPRIRR
jgi:hypothetical protein